MEQMFQLKHHGKLSLFEQNNMTHEDRAWYMKRLDKEFKDQQDQEGKSMPSMPSKPSTPRMPSMPSMPSMRR
jgi:hypothetical protein